MTDKLTIDQAADYLEKSDIRDEARAQSYNPNRILYNLYALAPIMGFAVAGANVSFAVALSFVGATWIVAGTAIVMDYSTGKLRHHFRARAEVARDYAYKLRQGHDLPVPAELEDFLDKETAKKPKYDFMKDPENALSRVSAIAFSVAASLVLGTSAIVNYHKDQEEKQPEIQAIPPRDPFLEEKRETSPTPRTI